MGQSEIGVSKRRLGVAGFLTTAALPLILLSFAAPARATFPGASGKFVFPEAPEGTPYYLRDIYAMDPDGTNRTRLTSDPANDWNPAWSPDGTKIAFTSNRSGNYEIYVMNADGTGQTNVTQNPSRDHYPSWSPDGTKIAFSSDRNPHCCGVSNPEIYTMNSDGSNQARATFESANGSIVNDDYDTAWSPDGQRIAFTRWCYAQTGPEGWQG